MRECYFQYANKSSEEYNLLMCYIGGMPETVISGAAYELSADSLPFSSEQLLYGKKYETPLEFEIEIIDPDKNIPVNKFREIKTWLFGQNGWKTLKLIDDEFSEYHLKCMFIPGEDILDGNGYRGVRCTLHNISPYWFGKPIVIRKDVGNPNDFFDDTSSKKGKLFHIDVHSDSDEIVLPTIRFKAKDGVKFAPFEVSVLEERVIGDGHTENPTRMVTTSFINVKAGNHEGEVLTLDLKYLQASYPSYESGDSIITDYSRLVPGGTVPPVYFKHGNNIVKIQHSDNTKELSEYFEWIEVEYTPMIALGGF